MGNAAGRSFGSMHLGTSRICEIEGLGFVTFRIGDPMDERNKRFGNCD